MTLTMVIQSRRLTLLIGLGSAILFIAVAGAFLGLAIYIGIVTAGTIYVYATTDETCDSPSDRHGIGLSVTGIVMTLSLLVLASLQPIQPIAESGAQNEDGASTARIVYPDNPYADCGGLANTDRDCLEQQLLGED